MKKTLLLLLVPILLGLMVRFVPVLSNTDQVQAMDRVFTAEELSEYDGKDGREAYTSYEGVVYDVTDSKLWKLGEHFGLEAGKDLTEDMKEAPHGDEVFAGFTIVGTLEDFAIEATPEDEVSGENEIVGMDPVTDTQVSSDDSPWYAKRIRVAGFSLLAWTGIGLGIFFVLTFGTCFALPWAKLPLPWKGKKIGPDPLDEAGKHMTWSSIHKHFVWFTVILGIIHGVLGFLQMMGIYL